MECFSPAYTVFFLDGGRKKKKKEKISGQQRGGRAIYRINPGQWVIDTAVQPSSIYTIPAIHPP
jgi:hypothetical protein